MYRSPEAWQDNSHTSQAGRSQRPREACGNVTCVDIKREGPDALTFTSTIDGNDGSVTYTQGEVSKFFAEVKDGTWDHLI